MKQSLTIATYAGIMAITVMPTFRDIASAQEAFADPRIAALVKCRSGLDERERLACYDRVAAAVIASDAGAATPTDRSRRQQAEFGRQEKRERSAAERVDTLDGKVVRVAAVDRIRFVVTLADGSLWRTTEATRSEPAVGDAVHIRRGALGSYLASFAKARSVRIERVR